MSKLFANLNSVQKEAVTYGEGPMLVLAGAGSGKTRVLTHRVAWLIEQGIEPASILAVTFTNKAATEMRVRVLKLLKSLRAEVPKSQPCLGTFHATCARVLRKHAHLLGFPNNFLIYDATDQKALIKQTMKELGLSVKNFNPSAILAAISSAKNELIDEHEYASFASGFFQEKAAEVYPLYQKLLRKNSALDFDDLQNFVVKLFQENPNILTPFQDFFQYILVDEYQDTNKVQYVLTKMLAGKYQNINVVGDCSQSIYAFRGANLRNVIQFKTDYPNAKVFRLEQNYRSTQKILDTATAVIAVNKTAHPVLRLQTENKGGAPISLYQAENEMDEAEFVVRNVVNVVSPSAALPQQNRFSDFAVLYRTNAQSRVLEEAFLRAGIPYKLVGGVRFYERREIKDILAYLRLIHNSNDSVSFKRIVNVPPRGIGPVALKAQRNRQSPIANRQLDKFQEMIGDFRKPHKQLNALELMDGILERIKYEDYINDGTDEGLTRWENVQELRSVAAGFTGLPPEESLGSFLESVALIEQNEVTSNKERVHIDIKPNITLRVESTDIEGKLSLRVDKTGNLDTERKLTLRVGKGETEVVGAVTLMTLHMAKGLEFPIVFIVGMEEGIFPHSRSLLDTFDLQEERRLCYVGITRAMKKLFLTFARRRLFFGNQTANPPSRFLSDIPEHLVEYASIGV